MSLYSVLAGFFCFSFMATDAFSYIDPGVAGQLYQLVYIAIAIVLSWFAGLKFLFYRIFNRFRRSRAASSPGPDKNQQ